jgi:hypothetical protein
MQKPNLNRMWETFIKVPSYNGQLRFNDLFDTIRFKISPMIQRLRNDGIVDWYCFLIHGKDNGVPTTQDDNSPYFHIRVSLRENDKPDFGKSLPDYCVMTRKIERQWVERISLTREETFDTFLFKDESIEEIWRIIGEQSEWLLSTLDAYKENVSIPHLHIAEFLHYYSNMTQMRFG